jgi:hypothetical protein
VVQYDPLMIYRTREESPMPTGTSNYRIAAKPAAIVFSAWTALLPIAVSAQTATWNLTPGSNDFSTAANWTPAVVPSNSNASTTAIFGLSNTTNLRFSDSSSFVGTLQFNAGAPAYFRDVQFSDYPRSGDRQCIRSCANLPRLVP